MKSRILIFIVLIFSAVYLYAITPEEIIKKVDQNEVFKSIKYTGVMTIKRGKRRKPFIKEFWAVAKGKEKAFLEFTNPADRGTKYLKLGDELWIKGVYSEEPEKISGHMLRESMMGSDYSYEDTMDNEGLLSKYNAKLLGKEAVPNMGECYKIELTAKVKKITYQKQIVWVDAKRFVAVKVQFFSISGELMKELTVSEIKETAGKFYPVKIRMENKVRVDYYTTFEMKELKLDVPVSESMFSMQQLEK